MAPLNTIVVSCSISSVIAIILMILAANNAEGYAETFTNLVIVGSAFGSQYIVLLAILFEIANVNSVVEHMVREELTLRHWSTDKLDTLRLSIYNTMQQKPIGAFICGFRPTVHELHFNIASSVLSLIIAIFWAIVFA